MSLTLIYFTWRQTRLLSLVYLLAISENGFGCIFKLLRDSLVPFSQSKSEFHFLQHFWKKFCLNNLDLFQNRGASYSQSPIRKMTVSVKWYEWCHNSDNPCAEQLHVLSKELPKINNKRKIPSSSIQPFLCTENCILGGIWIRSWRTHNRSITLLTENPAKNRTVRS